MGGHREKTVQDFKKERIQESTIRWVENFIEELSVRKAQRAVISSGNPVSKKHLHVYLKKIRRR